VLRPMMYAIVTSDNDFSVSVMELYGTLRLGKSSGTLWNFLTCIMEPNNYGSSSQSVYEPFGNGTRQEWVGTAAQIDGELTPG